MHDVPALGIGPMSRNAVNACINISTRHGIPLMLIASRRQIDTNSLGGGYVEHWTTPMFTQYVRTRASSEQLLICRDHGGPWQHPREYAYGCDDAMRSCLNSFKEDILAGFDLLHIDTSLDLGKLASFDDAVARMIQLYTECHEFALQNSRVVRFEIGFEDQGIDTDDPAEFEARVEHILLALAERRLPRPTFVVGQTGTKVIETENVGAIHMAPIAVQHANRSLGRVCQCFGVSLKAHNADYLSDASIRSLRRAGVSALNVAPEIGVAETKAFVRLLEELNLLKERDRFLELAFHSLAWRKWMKMNTRASDLDRAIIAGHYVFGTNAYKEIKEAALCASNDRPVDVFLREAIEDAIERFVLAFLPKTSVRDAA